MGKHSKFDFKTLGHARSYFKRSRRLRVTVNSFLRDVLFLALGILSAAFGLESFLLPNRFIDGGATGISLLLAGVIDLPSLYLLVMVVNIPYSILGFKLIGRLRNQGRLGILDLPSSMQR